MKLRTRMVPYASRMSADGEPNDAWHDAMAAHALLQAIEAWGKHPGYQGGESWVKHRAADILAGWTGEE